MILKASQRSCRGLAAHLLNERDNDEVEVVRLHGFVATDLSGAIEEVEAISRATRCKQPIFSLILAAPQTATVVTQDYEDAAALAMEKLGLAGLPFALVMHSKEKHRHAHLVVSRITPEIRAVNLAYFKERMQALAKELYLTHSWEMPPGLQDRSLSDPLNFTLEEWQLALRNHRDPREIKLMFGRLWSRSDGGQAFAAALQERGFALCRGDRRGYVAVDYLGNIYSLSRWLGAKAKELAARLGAPESLLSVDQAKQFFADRANTSLVMLAQKQAQERRSALEPLITQRRSIVTRQRAERRDLAAKQEARRMAEVRTRAAEFRKGVRGIFDWLTGRRKRTAERHRYELMAIAERDELERQELRERQRAERQPNQKHIDSVRHCFNDRAGSIHTMKTQLAASYDLEHDS